MGWSRLHKPIPVGKAEVVSSILTGSTISPPDINMNLPSGGRRTLIEVDLPLLIAESSAPPPA